ncbi:CPBP family intramembrane metalloprotease [Bacillus sp. Bva_UNVM-123]|uniref:CPBP family intramembrane glutamic endopeptidase n=1 Tax=Bacillus sp. Bva_UNVM-123 TaxID=2829798 RepID=UPI00391F1ECE
MKRVYWIILIAYIAMHLSSLVAVPLIIFVSAFFGQNPEEMRLFAATAWIVFSFSVTLIITLLLLRKEMTNKDLMRDSASPLTSVAWAIGGVFLAMIAQLVAANIERLLGIEMGSENTQDILRLIEASPIVILVSSIIGPILEEIVFRKIIFGTLYKRLNFFFAGLISSIIFAIAHTDFKHILLYTAMGFTFAFLYVRTKRIIVPIFAHTAMNTLVVLIQFNQDKIENWLKKMEQFQAFIGGFL